MNKLVCITGLTGSGKSAASDFFVEKGYQYLRFGQIVLDEVKRRNLEPIEANERPIREEFRKKHGMAAMAILNLPKFKSLLRIENVLGDGLYSFEEFKVLKKEFGKKFVAIAVYSSPEVRYERLTKRKLKKTDTNLRDRPMTKMVAASKRATCDRGRASCVFVKDRQILVTGYVGSPKGFPHCDEVGHLMKKVIHEDGHITDHCMRTIHAEQNAICQAAMRGVPLNGSTCYVNMTPCRTCAMLLINSGIKRVYAVRKYHAGKESEQMFKKAGVKLEYKFKEVQKYAK